MKKNLQKLMLMATLIGCAAPCAAIPNPFSSVMQWWNHRKLAIAQPELLQRKKYLNEEAEKEYATQRNTSDKGEPQGLIAARKELITGSIDYVSKLIKAIDAFSREKERCEKGQTLQTYPSRDIQSKCEDLAVQLQKTFKELSIQYASLGGAYTSTLNGVPYLPAHKFSSTVIYQPQAVPVPVVAAPSPN